MFHTRLSASAQPCARFIGRGLCLILSALALYTLAPEILSTAAVAQAKVPTAEDFSRLPAMTSFSISPGGKHFAAITSADGKTAQVSIWETANLSKAPTVLGSAANVRFMSVSFVKNERLAIETRQLLDYDTVKSFAFKTVFTDLSGSKWFTGVPEPKSKCVTLCSDEDRMIGNLERRPRFWAVRPMCGSCR